MYALLCSHAAKQDHCWPSHGKLATELSCSVSSVKRYLAELVAEKLVAVRQEQYRSSVYYLMRPEGLREQKADVQAAPVEHPKEDHSQPKGNGSDRETPLSGVLPKVDHSQPNVNRPQLTLSYLNNLKKQENTNSPLPPVQAQKPPTSSSGFDRLGGGGASCPDFEKAWETYPKKEAQGFARSAWFNLFRAGQLPSLETILSAIGRFAATESWQRDNGRYIPQMANFLRGQRWLDPLSPGEEQKAQFQEAVQSVARQHEALEAVKKAENERLRPLFDAFAEKFSATWNPNIFPMAFGTWRHLHTKGQAPFA